ncbi:MAG: hypothetical protein IM631_21465 [Cytophagales bacterium]|nr:hypothetical protein [Cytophagales bacterium]MCA6373936.1 hypothetical protein [Cytophagales bacterium]MCA6385539.1 hypothetical protein [Cytophagales bacterium]
MHQILKHKVLCFYSNDYTLILNFNGSDGNISGQFCLSSLCGSTNFPFKTFYSKDDISKFVFSLEWSFSPNENYGFTMFSGQILNPNVLILDWLMVGNGVDDYSIKGTNFLYSSMYYDVHGKKTPVSVKPFPLKFARHFENV